MIHITTWMNLQGIMSREKKPIPKHYILFDSIYSDVKFLKGQNFRNVRERKAGQEGRVWL